MISEELLERVELDETMYVELVGVISEELLESVELDETT